MQSQTKKSTRGFVVAITLPFPPRPTILGSASSTSTKPLKYILYHPHFFTFTFCRICINALKKGRAFFETTTSFFSQKIASQHLPLLSLPSSFRLSSPNLKYNGFLCSAHLLSLFFPFKSWFFPYSLMIT